MDTPAVDALAFDQLDHFAGFDWAMHKHDVVVVDRSGNIVLELEFADTAEGWAQLRAKLAALGKVGVAIETSSGSAVERLLELGLAVYPMNPKAAERFRDRKAPSGVKNDLLDAWSFAHALRSDGRGWRPLRCQDQQTQLLRLLCRDEIGLIELRTALVHQLKQALHEYYPAALDAFDDWTMTAPWDFVLAFPTPQQLLKAGRRKWQNFLHSHRLYRPEKAEKRLEIFARATGFASSSPAVTTAKSLLAVSIANSCGRCRRRLMNTAAGSRSFLTSIRTATFSGRSRVRGRSWLHGCWASLATTARSSSLHRPCSATRARPRWPKRAARPALR